MVDGVSSSLRFTLILNFVLSRKPRLGVALVVATLSASVMVTGILTYVKDLPAIPYSIDIM